MSRNLARRPLVLLAAGSLLATVACGSTVQTTGAPAGLEGGPLTSDGSGALGADGLGVAGAGPGAAGAITTPDLAAGAGSAEVASGSTFTGGGGQAGAPGAAGSSGGGSGSGPAGAPGTQAAAGAAPVAAGKNGPGVTAKEIFIGIAYTKNGDQANAAIGAAISRGDERENARAVIDEINEKGGVAGRKLVPVFHAYDAQSAETSAQQQQAACATFTEDNKVFASTASGDDALDACLAKAGVFQVTSGGIINQDAQFFRQFPSVFSVGAMSQDRMMNDLVKAFGRLDYFSGWDFTLARPAQTKPKLGILSLDTPTWNRPLDKVLLPALARAGHPVESRLVVRVHNPQSNGEIGQTVGDIQNAALRFRDAGVTHVVMLDATAFLTLTFLNNTRSQRYFPRLGANSATGMQALHDAGAVDPQQFSGAVGLGWLPTLDLPAGQGDQYLTPATKACLDNNKKRTGQQFTSTNAASIALSICDSINGIAAAIAKAGPVLNFSTGIRGMEAIGGDLRTAAIPKVFLGPGRHDGLELGFDLMWDSACTCAKYKDRGHRIAS
jgi:hypothetical protein